MLKNMTLGQYFPGDSMIHRMDPRIKFIIVLALIVVIFIAKTVWGYLAITAFLLFGALASRVPFIYVLKGLKPLWFILVFTFVINIFFITGEHILVEWWIIRIYEEGLLQAVNIAMRLILLIFSTTVLTLTTSPMEITDGLERLLSPLKVIKFPAHELALMMSIALRFIPTLMEETDRIMKAQTARGASFDTGGLLKRAKGMIPVLVPLFVSAFKRAEDLSLAMESRCYNGGKNRTRMKVLKIRLRDIVGLILVAAIITLIAFGF